MKTRLITALSFIMLISGNLFSQSYSTPPTDQTINPFWDFYATNYLNGPSAGMGNTGVASDNSISGVSLNPASLNLQKDKSQLSVQFTYKTTQPWMENLGFGGLDLKPYFLSVSAAFAYRINKHWQTGLVYSNPASMYFSEQIIRTDEFGNEIGRYDAYQKYAIHSITVPLVFSLEKFRFGINFNYSIYSNRENLPVGGAGGTITNTDFNGSFGKFNAQFGILFLPINNFSIGVAVTPELRAEYSYNYPSFVSDQSVRAIFPWKLAAGMEYRIQKSGWRFDADYNYARTKALDGLKDRNDVNIGAEYTVNQQYKVRAGFFTLFDFRKDSPFLTDPAGFYDQYFVTVGGSMKLKHMQIDLSILDSHISQRTIKNTYINAGISYNF
jgi:long-subunit fatty acid transport protein